MVNRLLLYGLLMAYTTLLSCQTPQVEYSLQQHETYMRSVVEHLADDQLQGREAGSIYAQHAATYIKEQMVAVGLSAWDKHDFTECFSPDNQAGLLPYCNVIGAIPGKGSLASDWILVSAHYDHIGIEESVAGDSIANGADDNATGVAGMLSIAKYLKSATASLKEHRGILFIAFDAEEKGLIGSNYFGKEFLGSQLPEEKLIAGVNLEMLGKIAKGGVSTAFMTGHDRSNLFDIMKESMKAEGVELQPDPFPAFGLFYRSDNASLAKKGVPAHTISTDPIDEDQYYHTVDDEIETIHFDNMTKVVKAIAIGVMPLVKGAYTPDRVEIKE